MDKRLFEIECWLKEALGREPESMAPASTDASFRRYYRITSLGGTYIVMDAPSDKEDTKPFLHACNALQALGLMVPKVLAKSVSRGILLLEDFGNRLYLDELNDENADSLYRHAIDALVTLQNGPVSLPAAHFPVYDERLLKAEMDLFEEWYVERHLNIGLNSGQAGTLRDTIELLTCSALKQPQTWVHRDYHSRNLMILADDKPGIIDFQDMVVGPYTYDLVSLLKDCYISWPRGQVEEWIRYFFNESGLDVSNNPGDYPAFVTAFDLMGVQRHLKVLGIFARLNYRDNKPQYLEDLPLVLSYLLDTADSYEQLQPFKRLLLELHPDAVTR